MGSEHGIGNGNTEEVARGVDSQLELGRLTYDFIQTTIDQGVASPTTCLKFLMAVQRIPQYARVGEIELENGHVISFKTVVPGEQRLTVEQVASALQAYTEVHLPTTQLAYR